MVGRRCQICDGAHQTFQCTVPVTKRNHSEVTVTHTTICSRCAVLELEVEVLRRQLEVRKPARDRAAYMREYRKRGG